MDEFESFPIRSLISFQWDGSIPRIEDAAFRRGFRRPVIESGFASRREAEDYNRKINSIVRESLILKVVYCFDVSPN